jgi:hypothetical protein
MVSASPIAFLFQPRMSIHEIGWRTESKGLLNGIWWGY